MFPGQPPQYCCADCGKQVCYAPDTRCSSCAAEVQRGWPKLIVYLRKWAAFEERYGPN